jgi:hypothetical protein
LYQSTTSLLRFNPTNSLFFSTAPLLTTGKRDFGSEAQREVVYVHSWDNLLPPSLLTRITMDATALEARFEQFTINDQNEDPATHNSYHKSKVSHDNH